VVVANLNSPLLTKLGLCGFLGAVMGLLTNGHWTVACLPSYTYMYVFVPLCLWWQLILAFLFQWLDLRGFADVGHGVAHKWITNWGMLFLLYPLAPRWGAQA